MHNTEATEESPYSTQYKKECDQYVNEDLTLGTCLENTDRKQKKRRLTTRKSKPAFYECLTDPLPTLNALPFIQIT